MADWTKPIPGPAVEGAEGHTEDHNKIVDAIKEIRPAVDAAEGKAAWGGVTGKPEAFPPADHTHAAGDITGTLVAARIPTLAQSKITGLAAKITELEGRLDALEAPEAG